MLPNKNGVELKLKHVKINADEKLKFDNVKVFSVEWIDWLQWARNVLGVYIRIAVLKEPFWEIWLVGGPYLYLDELVENLYMPGRPINF